MVLSVLLFSLHLSADETDDPTYGDADFLNQEWSQVQGFNFPELRGLFTSLPDWHAHCLQVGGGESNTFEPFMPKGTALNKRSYVDGDLHFTVIPMGEHGFNLKLTNVIKLNGQVLNVLSFAEPSLLHCGSKDKGCRTLANSSVSKDVTAQQVMQPEFVEAHKLMPNATMQTPAVTLGKLDSHFLMAKISAAAEGKHFTGTFWQGDWVSEKFSYAPSLLCEVRPAQ